MSVSSRMVSFSARSVIFALLFFGAALNAQTPGDDAAVKKWLATNSGVKSLQIEFTQTRTLRSIRLPIRSEGVLWLDYGGDRFRWQTGNPVQTIVTSQGANTLIMRTPMKKYELRPQGAEGTPGMAALANGFPRTLGEFQRKYRVLAIQRVDSVNRIVTKPLGASGRGVREMVFVTGADHDRLVGIEIALDDGSSLNTVFNAVRSNVAMPDSLFRPSLEGYRETKF